MYDELLNKIARQENYVLQLEAEIADRPAIIALPLSLTAQNRFSAPTPSSDDIYANLDRLFPDVLASFDEADGQKKKIKLKNGDWVVDHGFWLESMRGSQEAARLMAFVFAGRAKNSAIRVTGRDSFRNAVMSYFKQFAHSSILNTAQQAMSQPISPGSAPKYTGKRIANHRP
jgi:hypothetical protein